MITSGVCHSFKAELLGMATHSPTDVYKIALYQEWATIGPDSTAYTVAGECPATGGYYVGGFVLKGFAASLDGKVGILDFADVRVETSTITARGAMIYNSSKDNRAVAVCDFGEDFTSINGPFDIPMPEPTAKTAVIRIA